MAADFRCTIVTPDRAVFDGAVSYVSLPAWDGQVGVMSGRAPLLARLGIGSLRLDLAGGGTKWYLIDSGFAQVKDDVVTILSERAEAAEGIDPQQAREDLLAANARAVSSQVDREEVEADQERARVRTRLAARRG